MGEHLPVAQSDRLPVFDLLSPTVSREEIDAELEPLGKEVATIAIGGVGTIAVTALAVWLLPTNPVLQVVVPGVTVVLGTIVTTIVTQFRRRRKAERVAFTNHMNAANRKRTEVMGVLHQIEARSPKPEVCVRIVDPDTTDGRSAFGLTVKNVGAVPGTFRVAMRVVAANRQEVTPEVRTLTWIKTASETSTIGAGHEDSVPVGRFWIRSATELLSGASISATQLWGRRWDGNRVGFDQPDDAPTQRARENAEQPWVELEVVVSAEPAFFEEPGTLTKRYRLIARTIGELEDAVIEEGLYEIGPLGVPIGLVVTPVPASDSLLSVPDSAKPPST